MYIRAFAFLSNLFLLLATNIVSAQTAYVDSLKKALETATADTTILNISVELSRQFAVLTPDEVIDYAEQAIGLAKELGALQKELEAKYQSAVGNFYKGEFQKAKASLDEIEATGFYEDKPRFLGDVYNMQATVLNQLSDYETALDYYFKGLELARETKDTSRELTHLGNMGQVYLYHLDVEKGRAYYRQALKLAKAIDDRVAMAIILQNLGEFAGTPDSTLLLCGKAQEIFRELKYLAGIAHSGNTMGAALTEKGAYTQAKIKLEEAREIWENLNFTPGLSSLYSHLGNLFIYQRQLDSADVYHAKSIELAAANQNHRQLVETYSEMAESFAANSHPEKATAAFRNAMIAKDSLFNQEKAQQLVVAETAFETEQKEKQLIRKELTIQKQRNTQQLVIIGSGLALLLLLGIFQYLRNRQKLKAREAELALQFEKAEAEKLRELDRLKSNFFANISHEFRTPLTLIQTPLQAALKEGEQSESTRLPTRFARSMYRNARRLMHLVNQLLDLAKLESGRLQLGVKEEDMAHFIRTIGYGFESLALRNQINYHVNVSSTPFQAWFDREKLEHILANLLSNAFKFTPSEGRITLEAEFKSHGEAVICVHDNGIGIPEDQLPHIFERFYTSGGGKTGFAGSGIGMALTKELVELHHGVISAKSKVDHGTSITVRLPVARTDFKENELLKGDASSEGVSLSSLIRVTHDQSEAEAGKTDEHISLIKDGRPIVQIVEDNEDLREYIKNVLHQRYQVTEAINGRKGFEQAKKQIPDLIITDIMMPEMNGYELCNHIRKTEITSHIPVIMLTAKAEQEEKLEGLGTGADDYLTKPFDTRELLVRVHNLIEQRRLLRERFAGEMVFRPSEVATTSVDEVFLGKVLESIEKNMEEESFSVVELSQLMAMSRSQLHRKLKALVNKSPNQIIREMRLRRAKELLEKKAGNASEVAFMVGFNSLSYFSKCFKDQFGVAPSELVAT